MVWITETTKNDISTVYAYLKNPVDHKKCDWFTCFNDDYRVGEEREFINSLDNKYPGKYDRFHIAWCNSN